LAQLLGEVGMLRGDGVDVGLPALSALRAQFVQ
jgi:hypothetical protein